MPPKYTCVVVGSGVGWSNWGSNDASGVAPGKTRSLQPSQFGEGYSRGPPLGSRRSTQYLSIRYTERVAEADCVTSVGSRGDSYDNALAESVIGPYKTGLIRKQDPWKNLDDLEDATLEWVDWLNHRRFFDAIGHLPPAELEDMYYREKVPAQEAGLKQTSLR